MFNDFSKVEDFSQNIQENLKLIEIDQTIIETKRIFNFLKLINILSMH